MNEEEKVTTETSEVEDTTVSEDTDTSQESEEIISDEEETPEELRKRLAAAEEARKKAEEIARNQRIRAENAEKKMKAKAPVSSKDLESKDLVAIINANVAEEDIDEVVSYAKYRKTSVSEILKDPIMKSTLDVRKEERNSAAAAAINSTRRGTGRVPDDVLIENAAAGKLPETDRDIARLMKLRYRKN